MSAWDRFMAFVEFDPNGGCWLWTGNAIENIAGNLYPRFWVQGGGRSATRWALGRKLDRPLNEKEVCRHRCDVTLCVNPEHLEVGSQADNHADCKRRGRTNYPRGERHGMSSLTEMQVRAVRKLIECGDSLAEIGRNMRLTKGQVISARDRWKHIQ